MLILEPKIFTPFTFGPARAKVKKNVSPSASFPCCHVQQEGETIIVITKFRRIHHDYYEI